MRRGMKTERITATRPGKRRGKRSVMRTEKKTGIKQV